MEMYIAPIVGSSDKFSGSVYVMGHEDDLRCVFGRHGNDKETFYRLIRFENCGGAVNRTDVSIDFYYLTYFHFFSFITVVLSDSVAFMECVEGLICCCIPALFCIVEFSVLSFRPLTFPMEMTIESLVANGANPPNFCKVHLSK